MTRPTIPGVTANLEQTLRDLKALCANMVIRIELEGQPVNFTANQAYVNHRLEDLWRDMRWNHEARLTVRRILCYQTRPLDLFERWAVYLWLWARELKEQRR